MGRLDIPRTLLVRTMRHNLCSGVRWGVKGRRRQPIQEALIQVGRWNLLALGRLSSSVPKSHPGDPAPSLPPPWGHRKNTSHQQGLDQAIVKLSDMTIQVPRLCESALTPAASMGLLPSVDHGMPAQVV